MARSESCRHDLVSARKNRCRDATKRIHGDPMRHLIAVAALAATMPAADAAELPGHQPEEHRRAGRAVHVAGLLELPARRSLAVAIAVAHRRQSRDSAGAARRLLGLHRLERSLREARVQRSTVATRRVERQPDALHAWRLRAGARDELVVAARSMRSCVRSINGRPWRRSSSTTSRRRAARSTCVRTPSLQLPVQPRTRACSLRSCKTESRPK